MSVHYEKQLPVSRLVSSESVGIERLCYDSKVHSQNNTASTFFLRFVQLSLPNSLAMAKKGQAPSPVKVRVTLAGEK